MKTLAFMHRVVLNADAPPNSWGIGYHAMINPTDIEDEMTLEKSLLMELVPMEAKPLYYMVGVHSMSGGGNNSMLSYWGSIIQIENWFSAIFGIDITLAYLDEDKLNQMTLLQMRKEV